MCACLCVHCALWLRCDFSVITGNIPQTPVTQIKVVGEVKCVTVESLFRLNTLFSARWIRTLQTRHFCKETQKNPWCDCVCAFVTFHSHRWHLLYVLEEEKQFWCNVVQIKRAAKEQCGGGSVRIHGPGVHVTDGNVLPKGSRHLVTTETQNSWYQSQQCCKKRAFGQICTVNVYILNGLKLEDQQVA